MVLPTSSFEPFGWCVNFKSLTRYSSSRESGRARRSRCGHCAFRGNISYSRYTPFRQLLHCVGMRHRHVLLTFVDRRLGIGFSLQIAEPLCLVCLCSLCEQVDLSLAWIAIIGAVIHLVVSGIKVGLCVVSSSVELLVLRPGGPSRMSRRCWRKWSWGPCSSSQLSLC